VIGQSRQRTRGRDRDSGYDDREERIGGPRQIGASTIDIARAVAAVDRAIDRMARGDEDWRAAFERARAAWQRHVEAA
jgi:hypothetical protein